MMDANDQSKDFGSSRDAPVGLRRSVALIGLRGAGKSTVGRLLAQRLGVECLDTDQLIVASTGQSIVDIFAAEGEAGFRSREADAVAAAIERGPAVLSLGGGAVLDALTRLRLRAACHVICLTATVDVLWQRTLADESTASGRPRLTYLSGRDELVRLHAERAGLYLDIADKVVDTTGRSAVEVADCIYDFVARERR